MRPIFFTVILFTKEIVSFEIYFLNKRTRNLCIITRKIETDYSK